MTYRPTQRVESNYLHEGLQTTLAPAASIDTGWIDMRNVGRYQIEGWTDTPGAMSLDIDSANVTGGGDGDLSSSTPIAAGYHLATVPARQRWMRWQWTNTSLASVEASLFVKAHYGNAEGASTTTATTELSPFSQYLPVRALSAGQQPDGDLVNAPADGTAWTETTPLLADATVQSPWVDHDGFNGIELTFETDVPSANQGVVIDFTDDTQAGTPTVRASVSFSFTAADVAHGFLSRVIPAQLDGHRITYTNGDTLQTAFFAQSDLRTNANTQRTNQAGALLTADYLTEIALGRVSGEALVSRRGINSAITTGSTPEDVWNGGGLYEGQPLHSDAAEIVNIASTDTDDTLLGTGARTVRITYLNEDWEEVTETLSMAGLTAVPSLGLIRRCSLLEVLTAGSQGANDGTITVTGNVSGNTYVAVGAGNNRAQVCAYTIPAGQSGLLQANPVQMARSNGSPGSARVQLLTRREDQVYLAEREHYITDSQPFPPLPSPIELPALTDVLVRVQFVSDSTTVVSGELGILLSEA